MIDAIHNFPKGTKLYILAPIIRGQKGEFRREMLDLKKQGFGRLVINNEIYEIDNLPKFDKNKKHNIEVIVDRISLEDDLGNRLADSLEISLKLADGIVYVEIVDLPNGLETNLTKGQRIIFSEKYSCPVSGFQITKIEPRIFSFNSPFGACPKCEGIGTELCLDTELIIPDSRISIKDGAIAPWGKISSKFFLETLKALASHYEFSLDTPFIELPNTVQQVLFHGSGDDVIKFQYHDGSKSQVVQNLLLE